MHSAPLNPDSASLTDGVAHLDLVSALVEQVVRESDHSALVSPSMVKQAIAHAVEAAARPEDLVWYAWLDDVFEVFGFRSRVIDGSIEQVVDTAAAGVQIVVYCDDGSWLAVARVRRGRLLILRPDSEHPARWLTRAQFGALLRSAQAGESVRYLVLTLGRSISPATGSASQDPLRRYWELLQPEWPDIWIVIVFALVIGLLTLAIPIAVETLVNTVAFGKFLQPVVVLSLMLLAFLTFAGALRALQTYVVEIIQRRLFARVAADIAFRFPRVETEAMDGRDGREVVNRFFDVVVLQKATTQLLLDGVSLVLATIIGMALLAFYHPWLLGFDVMLLAMIALIVFVLGRGAVKSSIMESKSKYRMAAWLEELAACPTAFRDDGAARFALERADHLAFSYLTARADHFRILMRQIVFALGMQAVASTVLLGLGGWLVISGELTLGQLVASELIVTVIVSSFAKLGKHMESLYDVLASVDKLGILFDLPVERQDGLIGLTAGGHAEVKLRNVGYCSADGRQVLGNVNATIRAGDRIAITGTSCSGKSTLLDLLFGLRTPTQGQITLLGVELRELRLGTLRQHVALVRDVEVIAGSVADNVRLGRIQLAAADVRGALAAVGLLDDLLRLPQQLDTPLTSTGRPLSSTQLRRLMLARACAGSPSLLLLDAALDVFPDHEADALLAWLCRPEHPWALLLVTGREALATACKRRIAMECMQESAGSSQQVGKKNAPE